MNWTEERLAEALDHIRAIRESMAKMLLDMAEMSVSIVQMQEGQEMVDRMNARFDLPEFPAPSICPTMES
jgi:hypothetical protein